MSQLGRPYTHSLQIYEWRPLTERHLHKGHFITLQHLLILSVLKAQLNIVVNCPFSTDFYVQYIIIINWFFTHFRLTAVLCLATNCFSDDAILTPRRPHRPGKYPQKVSDLQWACGTYWILLLFIFYSFDLLGEWETTLFSHNPS